MGYKIGELFWKIEADTSGFDKNAKKTETSGKNLGKSLTAVGKSVTIGFTAAIVAGSIKISKELVSAASTAEEVRNKFNVVFSDISDEAQAAATNLAENFGLSTTAAEDLLAGTADLLTGFGFTQDAALGLSDQVNQLAADLGSFQNVDTVVASEAITKALLGERESIKQLGISILDADVKARVLINTQQGMTFESERQAKAYATLQLATEQSANAVGDYARSQDSFANKSREAKAAIDDLQVALGNRLLPTATDLVTVFADLADKIAESLGSQNLAKSFSEDFQDGIVDTTLSLDELNIVLTELEKQKGQSGRGRSQALKDETAAVTALIDAYGIEDAFLTNISSKKDAETERAAERARQSAIDLAEKAEREAEAAAESLVRLEEQAQAKIEVDERTAETRRILAEDEAAREQEYNENAIQNYRDKNAQMLADKQALVEAEILLDQQRLAAADSLFGGLSSLLAQAGKENKAAFIASKVFAAAQAGINSYLAFTKTLADGGPFPLNAINAAGVLAAGIAQQVQIASTPAPAFATGGIVPGAPSLTDNTTAIVRSGEEVINEQDSRHSFNSGGGQNMIVELNIDGSMIAKSIVNDYINTGRYTVNLKRGTR